MINLPRSTDYYRSVAEATKPSDAELVTLIENIQDELPCDGYRRLTHELRRPVESAQYASETYRRALDAAELQGSMSAIGNPYHNAQAESFMKTLKVEEVYVAGYDNFANLAERLPRFIEQIYNAKGLHSALGYRSPEEFETQLAQRAA